MLLIKVLLLEESASITVTDIIEIQPLCRGLLLKIKSLCFSISPNGQFVGESNDLATADQLTPFTPYDVEIVAVDGGLRSTSNPIFRFTTSISPPEFAEGATLTLQSNFSSSPHIGMPPSIMYLWQAIHFFLITNRLGTQYLRVDYLGSSYTVLIL